MDRCIHSLAVRDTKIFAGSDSGEVYLSTDNGTNWTLLTAGLPHTVDISSFVFIDTNIFAGTLGGGVFRSPDDGATWFPANSGLADHTVHSLAVIDTNLFAGTDGGGVFVSANDGADWTSVNIGLTNRAVRSLAISGKNLFAGTDDGVFLSANDGANWVAANTGLLSKGVQVLMVSGSNLFAGTEGAGVWRRPLSEMITSVNSSTSGLPREFLLCQNYPNPFNPSTTIRYGLPERSHVSISVYNTLGQQVATPVNGEMEAGYHEVQFDASWLASGVYLYRLQAGSFVETRKLVLVR
jgi:hypothetical protein